MIRLAVFGHPVTNSLSPRIHEMFARQCGLKVDYRAIDATEEDFTRKLDELITGGGRGCNITVPLKHAAWRLAGRCSESAQKAQAANTLVFEGSNCYADNTDGRGLVNDLCSNLGRTIRGGRICLVGAGGAAAGVLGDILDLNPSSLVIANRTVDKARDLARRYEGVQASSLDGLDRLDPFDLVINATSLGHQGEHPALPVSMFASDALCYDMNYGPAARALSDYCRGIGIPFQHGLGMLVEQAALSFELWTGQRPGTRPVLEALRGSSDL